MGTRRQGDAIILEPLVDGWEWLDAVAGPVDEDFVSAVAEASPDQDQRTLDTLT